MSEPCNLRKAVAAVVDDMGLKHTDKARAIATIMWSIENAMNDLIDCDKPVLPWNAKARQYAGEFICAMDERSALLRKRVIVT